MVRRPTNFISKDLHDNTEHKKCVIKNSGPGVVSIERFILATGIVFQEEERCKKTRSNEANLEGCHAAPLRRLRVDRAHRSKTGHTCVHSASNSPREKPTFILKTLPWAESKCPSSINSGPVSLDLVIIIACLLADKNHIRSANSASNYHQAILLFYIVVLLSTSSAQHTTKQNERSLLDRQVYERSLQDLCHGSLMLWVRRRYEGAIELISRWLRSYPSRMKEGRLVSIWIQLPSKRSKCWLIEVCAC